MYNFYQTVTPDCRCTFRYEPTKLYRQGPPQPASCNDGYDLDPLSDDETYEGFKKVVTQNQNKKCDGSGQKRGKKSRKNQKGKKQPLTRPHAPAA